MNPSYIPPTQKADSWADLEKLTDIIVDLLSKAWGEEWKENFGPEYPKNKSIEAPFIAYKTKARIPNKQAGIKPRLLERTRDPENGQEIYLYSQTFDCQIQFDIFHNNGQEANVLAREFESFLSQYTQVIKRLGIQEFVFVEQLEDDYDFRWRESYYVRSLVYYVRVQQITPIPVFILDQAELDITVSNSIETE